MMDWPTLCKCDLIYAVAKADLKGHNSFYDQPEISDLRRNNFNRDDTASARSG